MGFRYAVLAGALVTALSFRPVSAEDWPAWRGPAWNGISAETAWTDRWPVEGPRLAWRAEVGTGFSSFAVAGGQAYTLGHAEGKDTLYCFDAATGRILWTHSWPSDLGDRFFEGGPTSTPTVEGDRVYALGRWGDLFCLETATGRVHWSANIAKDPGLPPPTWGFSGSPRICGDLLILNAGERGLALEKGTGRVVWRSEAKEAGYSTPLPLEVGGRTILLLSTGKAYLAADLRTGKELWRVRWVTQYGVNAADPVADGGRIFLSSGYGRGGALLKLGEGEPETIWEGKVLRTQKNPAVLLGGYLYGIDGDVGQAETGLKCVEFETGKERWIWPEAGSGSVTAAGDRLIVLTEKGELAVGPASPEGFRPAARARVLEGKCWTVPVISRGRIYARNAGGDVVCLDVRAGREP